MDLKIAAKLMLQDSKNMQPSFFYLIKMTAYLLEIGVIGVQKGPKSDFFIFFLKSLDLVFIIIHMKVENHLEYSKALYI